MPDLRGIARPQSELDRPDHRAVPHIVTRNADCERCAAMQGHEPIGPTQSTAAVAERMRDYRRRLKRGARCPTLELRQTEIAALIARGFLASDDRIGGPAAIGAALGRLLDAIPPPRWPMNGAASAG
jgi:hypothetical protein